MVGVIIILAAGGKNGLAAAGEGHNRFGRSLTVHDLHLLARGGIHKLRIGYVPFLFMGSHCTVSVSVIVWVSELEVAVTVTV